MINFSSVSKFTFLNDYWQKKPLHIKNALPNFNALIEADELAGLAMEDNIESKVIFETPNKAPYWQLKRGPFQEEDFSQWPKSHWTLLVQGLDRHIPEISYLLDNFNFLPQWRVDDVMVSVAGLHGSVGPHYDNYDVFLYQAKGQRKWSLTSKDCNEKNILSGLELRIMADFTIEQEIILEEGDLLYIPPHIGHHGVSLTDESISYSFGYRSYQSQELWDSFADHLSETKNQSHLYKDPNWSVLKNSSEIPTEAYHNAKRLMLDLLDDETKLQHWFARFASQLDQSAILLLNEPLEEGVNMDTFLEQSHQAEFFERCLVSRFAYHYTKENQLELFINGELFEHNKADVELVELIACQRVIEMTSIKTLLETPNNRAFILNLWKQQLFIFNNNDL